MKFNERKFLVLWILSHYRNAVAVSPRQMAMLAWIHAPPDLKATSSFEREWAAFRRAAKRLAWTGHDRQGARVRAYVRQHRLEGGEVGYRLTRKGDRVRRKIARGTRRGYASLVDAIRAGDATAAPT